MNVAGEPVRWQNVAVALFLILSLGSALLALLIAFGTPA